MVSSSGIKAFQDLLVRDSSFQSFKLKKKLFAEGVKKKYCKECGWAKMTKDGYLPLKLSHIIGDKYDNRLKNLRILCLNCHNLKPTHKGKNQNRS